MNSNLSTVVNSLRGMLGKFLAALPYIVIALLVYAVFHTVAKMIRRAIMRVAVLRMKQHSAGLVVGRLAEGGVMLLGALVALMIAVPSFNPAQLVDCWGLAALRWGLRFGIFCRTFWRGF